MKNYWLMSDPHFGHHNVACVFKDSEGKPVRPYSSADEMDEHIIEVCNSKVKYNDTLYVMGDVAIAKKHIQKIARINCRKVLIKGNHDIFKIEDYLTYFDDVRACVVRHADGLIFSHIPLHTSQLARFPVCVHGHTHQNIVEADAATPKQFIKYDDRTKKMMDIRYLNVCIERLMPEMVMHMDDAIAYAKEIREIAANSK